MLDLSPNSSPKFIYSFYLIILIELHSLRYPPLRKEVLSLRADGRPSVIKFKEIGDRILNKIVGFVDTFANGITGS